MAGLRVGITGGKGFIGSHFVTAIKDEGMEAIIIPRLLNEPFALQAFLKAHPIDVCVHLAGVFSEDFDELTRNNLVTTHNLLEALSENRVKRLVFSSSGAVYGAKNDSGSIETDPEAPPTKYAAVKLFSEEVCHFYHRTKGINSTILRFPNVYGPNNAGVISAFLRQIDAEGKITIHGDGSQKRDFLHVDDAVQALILALHYPHHETYNISSPVRLSINELADELQKHFPFAISREKKRDDLSFLCLNDSKARSKLNYQPTVTKLQLP